MNSNSEKLQKSYNELLEFKMVLQKVKQLSCSNFKRVKPVNHMLKLKIIFQDGHPFLLNLDEPTIADFDC